MTRFITEKEEQAYRLCHHDFKGLTTREAAEKMGITPQCVNRYLRKIEKKFPKLFPILTKRQMDVYILREKMGMTHVEVGKYLGVTWQTAARIVHYMRKKGMFLQPDCLHRVDTYSPWMDSKVIRKF